MALVNGFHLRNLKGDILGGITAAVVALPLALAFGEAALGDGGAIYGLYGAVIAGFFAALLGGTPAQVSGPTGPMSVTVGSIVATLVAADIDQQVSGGLQETLPYVMGAVVIGGLFQILFGILRLGRYITLVPYSVVSGFMSGIGVIILLLQIGPLIGIKTNGSVISRLVTLKEKLFDPSLANVDQIGNTCSTWHFHIGGINLIPNFCQTSEASIIIGLMTLAIVFLTPRKISQWIPSPLIALIIITFISVWWFADTSLSEAGKVTLDRIGSSGPIPEGLPALSVPNFSLGYLPLLVESGLKLSLLGAIDSLLTSLVADNVSQTRHKSDRELIGQGIGNSVAGMFQGLPGAGATMRTVINIKSGGSTPISGMVHSLVLLLVLVGAGPLAAQIPTALLAGILIKVGLDIIDWGFLLRAHRLSVKTAVVMYGVLIMTVFWDLIMAVLVGVFIANLLTIDSITQTQLEGMDADNPIDNEEMSDSFSETPLPIEEQKLLDQCSNEVMLFRLRGPLSFGAAKGITERMMLVRNYKILILDITEVPRMGVTATLAIEDMVQEAKANSRKAYVAGAKGRVKERLSRFGVEELVSTRKEALEKALDGLRS